MILVEKHQVNKGHPQYRMLLDAMRLSKNLYNATLFEVRQHWFEHKEYLGYFKVNKKFCAERNVDYAALPAKVAQQTMQMVDHNFKSFFGALKARVPGKKIRIPKYLDKDRFYSLIYTVQAVSFKKKGFIKPSGLDFFIKTELKDINQLRINAPVNGVITVEVVYEVPDAEPLADNGKWLGVDLGVNNLMAVVSNTGQRPQLVNGRPLKSINQFYNKRKAELQGKLRNNRKTSRRIDSLTARRNNKVRDYMHKASRWLVNQAASVGATKIVIGQSAEWKQEIDIGRRNNQNFTFIPHGTLVNMVRYKAELKGIKVVAREESYTSKCSFLDNEEICGHRKYLGSRVKRGLFRTATGIHLNADVNGAANILRKEAGSALVADSVEVCSAPLVVTIK